MPLGERHFLLFLRYRCRKTDFWIDTCYNIDEGGRRCRLEYGYMIPMIFLWKKG